MGHQMSRRGGAGKGHPGWEDQRFGTVSCRRAEEPRGQGLAAGSAQTRGQGYRWTPQLGRVRRDTGLSGGRLVRGGRALAPRVQRPREEARARGVVITGEKGGIRRERKLEGETDKGRRGTEKGQDSRETGRGHTENNTDPEAETRRQRNSKTERSRALWGPQRAGQCRGSDGKRQTRVERGEETGGKTQEPARRGCGQGAEALCGRFFKSPPNPFSCCSQAAALRAEGSSLRGKWEACRGQFITR